MTEIKQNNWQTLFEKYGWGMPFTRAEAEGTVSTEELNRLIEIGMVLEFGSFLEIRYGVTRRAS